MYGTLGHIALVHLTWMKDKSTRASPKVQEVKKEDDPKKETGEYVFRKKESRDLVVCSLILCQRPCYARGFVR